MTEHRQPYQRKRGFSLLEVTIAIGLIAFSLVSIVSLLSLLLKVESGSAFRTMLPEMAESVIHSIKIDRAVNAGTGAPTTYTFHFTNEGIRIGDPNLAVISCEASLLPISVPSSGSPGGFTHLVKIDIRKPNTTQVLGTVHTTIRDE